MTEERPQQPRGLRRMLLDGGALALLLGLAFSAIGHKALAGMRCDRTGFINQSNLTGMAKGLDDFALAHHGRYPVSLDSLLELKVSGTNYIHCKSVPSDPWGREYQYVLAGPDGRPQALIYSLGRDGAPGGSGKDEDQWSAKAPGEDWTSPARLATSD